MLWLRHTESSFGCNRISIACMGTAWGGHFPFVSFSLWIYFIFADMVLHFFLHSWVFNPQWPTVLFHKRNKYSDQEEDLYNAISQKTDDREGSAAIIICRK